MGGIFGAIALVNAFLLGDGGTVILRGDRSMPLVNVLVAYLVIGPITGVLFGLALPRMRSVGAAYLTGALVSVPFAVSVMLGIDTVFPRNFKSTIVLVVFALTLGGIGGIMVREVARDS